MNFFLGENSLINFLFLNLTKKLTSMIFHAKLNFLPINDLKKAAFVQFFVLRIIGENM